MALVGLPLAAVLAVGVAYFGVGPKHVVVCNDQSAVERAFYGDRLGHVDGSNSTGCLTPSAGTYVIAGIAGSAVLASVCLLTYRTRAQQCQ